MVNRSVKQRIGIAAGVVLVVWVVVLLVLGSVFGDRRAQALVDRLRDTLGATSTVGDHDLGLLRGRLQIDRVVAHRSDLIGKLSLEVGSIRCELWPFGGALIDSSCRELALSDVRLELSTFALFRLKKPTRPPIQAQRVKIENVTLVFAPAGPVPSLGRIALTIDHATAGPTVLKTPLSWLFSLDTLQARLELPFGTIRIGYAGGSLRVGGALFGDTTVTLPFKMPAANHADDPKTEVQRLREIGVSVGEQLFRQKAQ